MKKLIVASVLLISSYSYAACPQFYPLGKAIDIPGTIELCNSFYVVKFDTKLNEVIFSAEKFQTQPHTAIRTNDFHSDIRIPSSGRASNADYAGTGFDKGHMTPAADAINSTEMSDTFLLSNMTPQEPTLNRESWRLLEEKVRTIAPDYVLTGAIYSADHRSIGIHHIPVPLGYYKIIWKNKDVSGFCASNQPKAVVTSCTVRDIAVKSGIDFTKVQ